MNRTSIGILSFAIGFGLLTSGLQSGHLYAADKEKQSGVEERIKNLEDTVKAMQFQQTRMNDIFEIERLQARYEAIHNAHEELAWKLFADRDDSSQEITHTRLIGFKYIKMNYLEPQKLAAIPIDQLPPTTVIFHMTPAVMKKAGIGPPPSSADGSAAKTGYDVKIHPIATPNIVIADDGKTAKATFTSLGFEAKGWCYGKYANSYIKIDGKWYIWHMKWLRGIRTPYYKSFQDQTLDDIFDWTSEVDENGFPVVNKNLNYDYLFYPGKKFKAIPAAPKPYATWTAADEDGGWWKHETDEP
jgi:hypothetical protein